MTEGQDMIVLPFFLPAPLDSPKAINPFLFVLPSLQTRLAAITAAALENDDVNVIGTFTIVAVRRLIRIGRGVTTSLYHQNQ